MFPLKKIKVFTLSFLSSIIELLYNLGHNIFEVLLNFSFTTSETGV